MFQDKLVSLGACPEAVEWVGDRAEAEAWAECTRPDWMVWYLRYTSGVPLPLAVDMAEYVLRYVPGGEDRPRAAVAAARACLEDPSEENRRAAADAARAAARVTRAAATAATAAYAAYAAAGAAAHAAVYATANKKINLVAIARKAYRWKE